MANAHRPVNERSLYDALTRYRAIAPGSWDDFMESVRSPQPVTVWRNAPRIGHEAFTAWMEEYEGVTARSVAWDSRLYRLGPEDHPRGVHDRRGGFHDRQQEPDDERRDAGEQRRGPGAEAARVKPGNLLAFGAGLYHVQEETAAMPAVILTRAGTPAPGAPAPEAGADVDDATIDAMGRGGSDAVGRARTDVTAGGGAGAAGGAAGGSVRILDLCAAPGNKSAQLAQVVGPAGTIVANDVSERRLRSGVPTWERLGLTNIAGTVYDGRNFPRLPHAFDAVLVDAPCTGEGTCRRNPGALRDTSQAFRHRLQEIQAALLRRAVELCRPGGRIIYCTCTFAPEENEEQIDALLRNEIGETVVPELIHLEGITGSPGIEQWEGRSLDPGVRRALRIWPHQNDTGGFFIASLRKAESP